MGITSHDIKLGVLDGGFDEKAKSHVKGQIRGTFVLASSDPEQVKHGTYVVGRLAEAAPGETIEMNPIFSGGSASESTVAKAAMDMCKNGRKVICMSAASDRPIDKVFEKLWSDLAREGCILIAASGNANLKGKNWKGKTLTVRQTNQYGKIVKSNDGVISAPGAMIVAVNSEADHCGPGTEMIEGGTSHAAPLACGVVQRVYEALENSPKFAALNKTKKIEIVDAIIRKSAVKGALNGYRALKLEQAVVRSFDGDRPPVVDTKLLNTATTASAKQQTCYDIKDCDARLICYKDKRREVALADDPKSKPEAVQDLFRTAKGDGADALANIWFDQVNPVGH